MNSSFVSIKSVMDRIYAHPMMVDLPYERALVWTVDVIRLIGSQEFLDNAIMRVLIEGYRGPIPLDLVNINALRKVVLPSTNDKTGAWSYVDGEVIDLTNYNNTDLPYTETYEPMYEASDPFHKFYKQSKLGDLEPIRSYKINGNFIYTSFEYGVIDVSYERVLCDQDGLPMIPNDPTIEKAIENYVKSQYFTVLSDLGKDVVRARDNAEKEYCWYIGKAQNRALLLSLDGRESLSNAANRLILNSHGHQTSFRQLPYSEQIRKQ